METIQNKNKKNATFSSQKLALFKKACKLEMECNAEVGIVLFSPNNKPYTFGKPNFNLIAEEFKNELEISDNIDDGDKVDLEKIHKITKEIRAEKKRGKELRKLLESAGYQRYEKTIEELTHKELKELESELEIVHDQIECNINHMLAAKTLICLSKDKGDRTMIRITRSA